MTTTKAARDLKAGEKVTIHGFSSIITHIRKSRQYSGYMKVQMRDSTSPAGVRAFDVRCADEFEVAI